MRIVSSFPRRVRDIENVFIPVSGGGRVAARIWLPEDAESSPVPAILQYVPYRKGDRIRDRDEPMHRYFAGHGYAAVRADLRGTGDSDGVLLDEYLPQEIDDAREVIRWLAAQTWCTGAVGIDGKVLGRVQRPPGRRVEASRISAPSSRFAAPTIVTPMTPTSMGGSLLNENLFWGSVLTALRVMPPDPHVSGERWRDMWRECLQSASPLAETWLRHQRRHEYWKQGSVSLGAARR